MERLNTFVTRWHSKSNTIEGSTLVHQTAKLGEESMMEISRAIINQKPTELKDSIGDSLVVINCLSNQAGFNVDYVIGSYTVHNPIEMSEVVLHLMSAYGQICYEVCRSKLADETLEDFVYWLKVLATNQGWDIEDCYELAYNTIKDRKIKMVNCIAVKEEDL